MDSAWILIFLTGNVAIQMVASQTSPTCSINRLYAIPNDCTRFISCAPFGEVTMNCPQGLYFNEPIQVCDWPFNVPRCRGNVPQNACQNNPCQNGRCVPNGSGYTCDCSNTIFSGSQCQFTVCDNQPTGTPLCRNGGTCFPNQFNRNTYTCQCTPQFEGPFCDSPVATDMCISRPCVYGTCRRTFDSRGYACDCFPGYGGLNCEQQISGGGCSPNPCRNGGRCIQGTGSSYSCDCSRTQYQGRNCEVFLTSCNQNPCLNGGRCNPVFNGFSCDCRNTGFVGFRCQALDSTQPQPQPQPQDPCRFHNCRNGRCVPNGSSYTCDCTGTIYSGPQCQFSICDTQPSNPCQNGGTCVPHQFNPNIYTCLCVPPFQGPTCVQIQPSGSNCPAYPCPQNVTRYNYPAWNDMNCQTYYNCEFGVLQIRACGQGERFDVLSMSCQPETEGVYVFCNAFRS